MTKERHKIMAAVYLLLIKDGKVAMLRRFNTGYQDGNYTLPSGHIDAGESALQATVREAKEETGVTVKVDDLKLVHMIHRNSPESDRVYADFYFVTTEWEGEPKNMEPEKADDLSWFELEDLPKNIIPDVKIAIESYASGDYYSEFGW